MEQLGSHWTDFHEIWYLARRLQNLDSDYLKGTTEQDNFVGYLKVLSCYLSEKT
jgi:hypothetical protein